MGQTKREFPYPLPSLASPSLPPDSTKIVWAQAGYDPQAWLRVMAPCPGRILLVASFPGCWFRNLPLFWWPLFGLAWFVWEN